jgi:histidine triad (HIT) family protein
LGRVESTTKEGSMNTKDKTERCHFCAIARGEKEEEILYESDEIVAFPDINPRTPTHILIMPRRHFGDFEAMMREEPELLVRIGEAVEALVDKLELIGKWYTWGFHCGGKQSVNHIHAQLLAGMRGDELVL